MYTLLKKHQDRFLIAIGIILLLIIAGYYILGIQALNSIAGEANTLPNKSDNNASFNFEITRGLTIKGLQVPQQ